MYQKFKNKYQISVNVSRRMLMVPGIIAQVILMPERSILLMGLLSQTCFHNTVVL